MITNTVAGILKKNTKQSSKKVSDQFISMDCLFFQYNFYLRKA